MNKKEQFLAAKNYRLYYGRGQEEKLSRYDVAIVEPLGQTAQSLQSMKESGTLVFAYISVMEIHPSSKMFCLLDEKDFLKHHGSPLLHEVYGNYIIDIRSKKWRTLLEHQAGKLLFEGYDGLFLDTLGDVEMDTIPVNIQEPLMIAIAGFLQNLRNQFPECLLIQNNGLLKLCHWTGEFVDGICWENPPFDIEGTSLWTNNIIETLRMLKKEHHCKILLLLEQEGKVDNRLRQTADTVANQEGFLLYYAPKGYTE